MSETLDSSPVKINKKDNFVSMAADLLKSVNFKIAFILFFVGIFIFSDIFIEKILTNINGASYAGNSTTKGTVVQLSMLTMIYVIIDLMVQGDII